ncbi:unnamed protein product [Arctia plantaginis]|uniref:Uncharacterized protein n=1 Tax=Arctia plantaginis TaxID=874455 RepID=A0A8S1A4A5_ARCPL|nr:unnamed protein product [Arctia plantaginis]
MVNIDLMKIIPEPGGSDGSDSSVTNGSLFPSRPRTRTKNKHLDSDQSSANTSDHSASPLSIFDSRKTKRSRLMSEHSNTADRDTDTEPQLYQENELEGNLGRQTGRTT